MNWISCFLEQEAHFYMPWIQNIITCRYGRALKNTASSQLALSPPTLSLLTEYGFEQYPMRCPLQEIPPVEGVQTPQTLRFAGEEMVISKSGILYHKEISRMDFYFQSGICFRDA